MMICSILGKNVLKDSTVTKMASQYIVDNRDYVVNITTRMTKGNTCIDVEEVVQDVYLSFLEQERLGGGFDTAKDITLEQFVFGRIRGYLKNNRYRGFDVKATNGDLYPVNASMSEDLDMKYVNAPSIDTNLERIADFASLEHDLITCILATQTAHISLLKILTSPIDMFTSKTWGWVIKTNFNREECEALRNVLEYPDRQELIQLLDKVLPSFAS